MLLKYFQCTRDPYDVPRTPPRVGRGAALAPRGAARAPRVATTGAEGAMRPSKNIPVFEGRAHKLYYAITVLFFNRCHRTRPLFSRELDIHI